MVLVEEPLSIGISGGVPVDRVPLTMVLVEEVLYMGVSVGIPVNGVPLTMTMTLT